MKKSIILLAFVLGAFTANAQSVVEGTKFTDNWSVEVNAGAITPLTHSAFFKSMRRGFGVGFSKQLTPIFGLGFQGMGYINTTPSKTAFDASDVSLLGKVNLMNLFASYQGEPRLFEVEAVAGMGWLHYYVNGDGDQNSWSTRFGLNFNFNLGETKAWTLGIKPAIVYDMQGSFPETKSRFNANNAAFELTAGLTYHFKTSTGNHYFTKVKVYNQAEIDGLNSSINALRSEVNNKDGELNTANRQINGLQKDLEECRTKVVPVATEIISDRNKILGVASDFLINYKKNQLQYQLFSFSEAEIEILNRIALISKKRELLILADDVEKWDSESKKLLGKLIALQNDIECSFFKDTVFVLATNNIKSLNIKISKYYQEVINVDLSYKTFSEEAKKINLSNDKIIHELYDITKGNIGLIANIKEYIDLSSLTGTESLQKQLFQILDKRITSSDKITKEILDALQTATIIGKEFNLYFLNKLLEEPIGILDYYMGLGCEEKFITKEDIQNHYSFSTDTLYNFFVSKLNGRSADCHYKFAKILEKIAPYQFYLRYFHMKQSGNIMEAIPLLTVHCIRQCIEGKKPSEELLNILQEYGNYWNVYQSINYSLKNYRNDNKYTQYYDLIESSDICVHPIVSVEKDYVLCLLKYRTGNINDFKEIEHTLTKYFSEEIDFSQHIRIGLLLFLLYCNRLGEYEKAQKIEKTITWQIQQEISNCEELQKEIRIVERLSPALYSNEVA